jgi:hypothetical protein
MSRVILGLAEFLKRLLQGTRMGTSSRNSMHEPTPSEVEEVVRLLRWFGETDTPDLHGTLARVVAAKLWRVFFIMPIRSAKPTKSLLRQLRIEAASDPMSTLAVHNLRIVLQSSSQTAAAALERLSRSATDEAGQEAFIEMAIHADLADQNRGWNHLVAFENSKLREC